MTDTLRGALWMLGTIFSFSVMAVAGREASDVLDTFELMLYRSIVGLVIVAGVITATRRWHEVPTRHFSTHLLRNLAHFTGQNLWFYAVTVVPLAQVFALEFTSPLWVIVLSPLLLGERLTATRAICALVGFIGILIVARPGATPINAGLVTAASCAIFFALTIMLTKRLTRADSIACILFYLTALQLVMGLVASGYDGDIALPDMRTLPFVIAIGLGGLLAHFCYTKALSLAPATLVSPIDFGRLPAIALAAWVLYGEAVDIWVFIGAALIFGGNYLNIMTETRRAARA
ncbi:DMT family transporter [Aliishimia ponticola]|uniref:DMT family transporter n=1 Tax=Aliishimia ponticola TaxID=2499833 RepID=A0A4S4NJI1_9RHOB|nr:DMT family transporter [Aliishimia ponticola]THH38418.1 DMT family transporter [Aliishimia ponticola]